MTGSLSGSVPVCCVVVLLCCCVVVCCVDVLLCCWIGVLFCCCVVALLCCCVVFMITHFALLPYFRNVGVLPFGDFCNCMIYFPILRFLKIEHTAFEYFVISGFYTLHHSIFSRFSDFRNFDSRFLDFMLLHFTLTP